MSPYNKRDANTCPLPCLHIHYFWMIRYDPIRAHNDVTSSYVPISIFLVIVRFLVGIVDASYTLINCWKELVRLNEGILWKRSLGLLCLLHWMNSRLKNWDRIKSVNQVRQCSGDIAQRCLWKFHELTVRMMTQSAILGTKIFYVAGGLPRKGRDS